MGRKSGSGDWAGGDELLLFRINQGVEPFDCSRPQEREIARSPALRRLAAWRSARAPEGRYSAWGSDPEAELVSSRGPRTRTWRAWTCAPMCGCPPREAGRPDAAVRGHPAPLPRGPRPPCALAAPGRGRWLVGGGDRRPSAPVLPGRRAVASPPRCRTWAALMRRVFESGCWRVRAAGASRTSARTGPCVRSSGYPIGPRPSRRAAAAPVSASPPGRFWTTLRRQGRMVSRAALAAGPSPGAISEGVRATRTLMLATRIAASLRYHRLRCRSRS